MTKWSRKELFFMGLLLSVILVLSGCTGANIKRESAASPAAKPKDTGPAPFYHDFADVLLPGEMKVDQDKSVIYNTAGFSVGLLLLKGRVGVDSLVKFFENNMAKDNWQNISTYKYRPVLMLFQKENRSCVIRIEENSFQTDMEIWVAPNARQTVS